MFGVNGKGRNSSKFLVGQIHFITDHRNRKLVFAMISASLFWILFSLPNHEDHFNQFKISLGSSHLEANLRD
jgi:hypothetical protein